MPTHQRTTITTILRQLSQGILNNLEAAKAIKETYFLKGKIMPHDERMQSAIRRAKSDYPILGWYGATESAADAYNVSLPELQRALDNFLKSREG